MSTLSVDVGVVRPWLGSRWQLLRRRFIEWRLRARTRRELAWLDEKSLRDLGLSRCDAIREANKPFWTA